MQIKVTSTIKWDTIQIYGMRADRISRVQLPGLLSGGYMEQKLIVLKLFLNALNVDCNIQDVSDRKGLQKAVYLGQQLSGIDLGYRYGWYKLGPYCSELTDDYYQLSRSLRVDADSISNKQLPSEIVDKLKSLIPILTPPTGWQLPREDWLELIASYHYLRTVRRKSHDDALSVLQSEKKKLAPHVSLAMSVLGIS
jgi:hypothetical protein